jgi:hypothetical protein
VERGGYRHDGAFTAAALIDALVVGPVERAF